MDELDDPAAPPLPLAADDEAPTPADADEDDPPDDDEPAPPDEPPALAADADAPPPDEPLPDSPLELDEDDVAVAPDVAGAATQRSVPGSQISVSAQSRLRSQAPGRGQPATASPTAVINAATRARSFHGPMRFN